MYEKLRKIWVDGWEPGEMADPFENSGEPKQNYLKAFSHQVNVASLIIIKFIKIVNGFSFYSLVDDVLAMKSVVWGELGLESREVMRTVHKTLWSTSQGNDTRNLFVCLSCFVSQYGSRVNLHLQKFPLKNCILLNAVWPKLPAQFCKEPRVYRYGATEIFQYRSSSLLLS